MTKWSIPIHMVQVQTCDYTSAEKSALLKKVALFYVQTLLPSNTQTSKFYSDQLTWQPPFISKTSKCCDE